MVKQPVLVGGRAAYGTRLARTGHVSELACEAAEIVLKLSEARASDAVVDVAAVLLGQHQADLNQKFSGDG
ncbi:MAG: hypothetical protein WDO24_01520 [Pseudomonadota bacterium]